MFKGIIVKNEKGFTTMMMVSMVSFFMLSTFTTFYVYSINRMKHHSRIREAYNMVSVMEQAGKAVKSAYDRAGGTASTPAAVVAQLNGDRDIRNADPNACKCDEPAANICIEDINDPTEPYCLTIGNANNTNVLEVGSVNSVPKNWIGQKTKSFVAKLNHFFDERGAVVTDPTTIKKPTIVGWLLREKTALAGNPVASEGSTNYPGDERGQEHTTLPPIFDRHGTRDDFKNKSNKRELAEKTNSVNMYHSQTPLTAGPAFGCTGNETNVSCRACGEQNTAQNCMKIDVRPKWFNGANMIQAIAIVSDTN